MSLIINNMNTPAYNVFRSELQAKIDTQFPTLSGVPGSWADLTFFVEAEEISFLASQAAAQVELDANVSAKTLRNRRKRQRAKEAKAARKANEVSGCDEIKHVIPCSKKQIRGDTLIMKNLPPDARKEDIINKLGKHGSIKFVRLIVDRQNNCKGIGFVRFASRNVATDVYATISTFRYKNSIIKMEIV